MTTIKPPVTRRPAPLANAQRTQQSQAEAAGPEAALVGNIRDAINNATQGGVFPLDQATVESLIKLADNSGMPEVHTSLQLLMSTALDTEPGDGVYLNNDAKALVTNYISGTAPSTQPAPRAEVDALTERELGGGLAPRAAEVSHGQTVETHNQLQRLRVDGQTGRAVSKKEFSPAHTAVKDIGNLFSDLAKEYLNENLPAIGAATEAIAPAVEEMIGSTISKIATDPEAMARVSAAVAQVGKEGFIDAVQALGGDIGRAFTQATGLASYDPSVLKALFDNLPKLAEKFLPDTAESIGDIVDVAASKFDLENISVDARKGIGQSVSTGSALTSAAGFVSELFSKPRNGERIAKAGISTLLQTVGIAFPQVARAGELVDAGWSAKLAKEGIKDVSAEPALEIAALTKVPAEFVAAALRGAGQENAAKAFDSYAELVGSSVDSGKIADAQMKALGGLAQASSQELTKAAAEEKVADTRDSLANLAHGFGQLFKVFYVHRKSKGPADGPKHDDLKAQLLEVAVDVAKSAATLYLGNGDKVPDQLAAPVAATNE